MKFMISGIKCKDETGSTRNPCS